MEHVEGETLSKQIPPRGFAMERLLSLAIALADAVSAVTARASCTGTSSPRTSCCPPTGG